MTNPSEQVNQQQHQQQLMQSNITVASVPTPDKLILYHFGRSYNGFQDYVFDPQIPYEDKRRNFRVKERGYKLLSQFKVSRKGKIKDAINKKRNHENNKGERNNGLVQFITPPGNDLIEDVIPYISERHEAVDRLTDVNDDAINFSTSVDPSTDQNEAVMEWGFTNSSTISSQEICSQIYESGMEYQEELITVTTLTSSNPFFNDPKSKNNTPSVITILKSASIKHIPECILKMYLQDPNPQETKRIIPIDVLKSSRDLLDFGFLNNQQMLLYYSRISELNSTCDSSDAGSIIPDDDEYWSDAVEE